MTMNRYTRYSCGLVLLLLLLSVGKVAGRVFATNTSITFSSTFVSVEALDAMTLTTISWTRQGHVAVYFDRLATDSLRFSTAENETALSSSSMSSLWTPENESDYTPFPEDLGPGADICDLDAYVVDPQHPFDNEAVFERATVELQNFSTWWYTSTLGQDAQAASAAVPASDSGSASVLLGDPGFYVACLVLSEEDCIAIDCVEFLVHQPNSDFFQVSSTNIGAIVTVHFNVASFEANLGDWGWVLAGVDPAFDVQDANAFINDSGSGAVYTRFSEGCWFYFGQAAVLSKPFLCSRDPDAELSALQSSTLNEPYQYGSLEFYSAASGNLSIWYAFDEQFDFAMVQSYFTCGIDLVAPESLVVNSTSDVVVVGEPHQGEGCAVGAGIALQIHTLPMTFHYVDIPASIFFRGAMDAISPTFTSLSINLPVIGNHSVVVSLESGGILKTLDILSISGEPYAPNSVVISKPPTSMAANSSSTVSFSSRDFYNNDIAVGYGDDAFQAWMTTPKSPTYVAAPRDVGDGSYQVDFHTSNETGIALFFVQRHGLSIPGSPFESFIVGPEQCVIESLDIDVGECISSLHRTVVHEWKDGISCEGGLALPSDSRVSCGFIPAMSSLGRTLLGLSIVGAVYSVFYLGWIMKNRKTWVVKMGQPFVCQLFLLGCIALNLTAPFYLGQPSDFLCRARPCVLHTALTFAISCLYMKTYRVHRLFNNQSLVRMSISDRDLVLWVLRLVAVDVVLLTLWMVIDDPHASTVRTVRGYAEVLTPVCAPGAAYFSTILWVYKAALNTFGVVMAAKTWNCADGVGESHSICLSVYNAMLLGLVNLVVHLFLSDNVVAKSCVRSFSAVGGTVFTVSVVFGPKVYKLWRHGDVRISASRQSGHPTTNTIKSTATNRNYTSRRSINTERRLSSTANTDNRSVHIAAASAGPRRSFQLYKTRGENKVIPEAIPPTSSNDVVEGGAEASSAPAQATPGTNPPGGSSSSSRSRPSRGGWIARLPPLGAKVATAK